MILRNIFGFSIKIIEEIIEKITIPNNKVSKLFLVTFIFKVGDLFEFIAPRLNITFLSGFDDNESATINNSNDLHITLIMLHILHIEF